MAGKKRKPRKNIQVANKLSTLYPISITEFGSEKDPCFGKLYDPKHDTCGRCGDSEFCSIAMAQNNHVNRLKVEKTTKFKDIEEQNIKPTSDKKALKKEIKSLIRKMIKEAGKGGIPESIIINAVSASYGKDGFTRIGIGKIITKLHSNNSNITFKNNMYLWTK